MSQISRPFQIALAALVLFAALWFVVLRGHSSSGESSSAQSSSAQSASSQPAAAPSSSSSSGPSSPASTYHGAAPGVAGLTRAIAKARGAVQQSQQNAQQLQQKSDEASSSTPAPGGSATNSSGSGSAAESVPGSAAQQSGDPASSATAANGAPVRQAKVESQLAHGKIVAILFWNPTGSVDAVVRRELHAAGARLHGRLAVNVARSNQVGSFGIFTNAVQVYSTPTILLVNRKGATTSLTGLTDAFAIEQAVSEVKHAR